MYSSDKLEARKIRCGASKLNPSLNIDNKKV